MRIIGFLLVLTAAFGPVSVSAAQTVSHGALLAATCAACHGTNGNSVGGTPVLAGLDPDYFSAQMHAFQRNERASTVMHHLSKDFTEAEIGLLAKFFASQPRVMTQPPAALAD
jgi:sulfide dehydrogenase cytochrome subunit